MPYDATKDPLYNYAVGMGAPVRTAAAVTPNDSTDLTVYATAIFVGGAGNIVLLPVGNADGSTVTLAVPAGAILPIRTRRVLATGTTATGIVALTV